jgi:hypothetical protein
MSQSNNIGDSSPVSLSLSSEHPASLVDLEETLWVDAASFYDDGHDEASKLARGDKLSHRSNLRLLQEFMSTSESDSEGSGQPNGEPSSLLYKSEGESGSPSENEIHDRIQNSGAADKGEEEEEKEAEGEDGAAGSDLEAVEAEIYFDIEPGLLDRLANIGADDP